MLDKDQIQKIKNEIKDTEDLVKLSSITFEIIHPIYV